MQQSKKKKLIQINTVCNTSTGQIMGNIQREALRQGYDTLSLVGRRQVFTDLPCKKFGSPVSFWLHVALNTIFDKQGYGSLPETKKLVARLREENPDIIHLHNLHGYYLNLPVLFHYLKNEYNGKLFWTFHDCWSFTGHCAYFTMAGCDKWKKGCFRCPNKTKYPVSLFLDSSQSNYKEKKELFTGLKNLTIITPSKWMAGLVNDSFFKDYPVEIVPNGIDLKNFTYTIDDTIYEKYRLPRQKKILLGVANVWDARKGLNDFIALSKAISSGYCIVLVGLSQVQIRSLPPNIIGIKRTENQKELAALYSLAEVFINPSLEESFSLVTVEAFACGTPVIVLDTSAVKELVTPENGIVLNTHAPQDYIDAISALEKKKLSRGKIAESAKKYDSLPNIAKIVSLYEKPH